MKLLTRTRLRAALILLSFNFLYAGWSKPNAADALESRNWSDNSFSVSATETAQSTYMAGTAGGVVLLAEAENTPSSSSSSSSSSSPNSSNSSESDVSPAPQAVSSVASLSVSNESPKQGQTIEITYRMGSGETEVPSIQFYKESYKLLPAENLGSGAYRCLLGIPADIKPGKYKLIVGNVSKTLAVGAGKFAVQYLRLPKSKDNFIMSAGEEAAVDGAKKTVSAGRAWSGNFTAPCKARISAGFGLRRVVNGKLLDDYFHSGLDYAAGTGAPVRAVAPGKIILARTGYKLHGNMVSIDHGEGVVTFYIHLSKVLVKEGQLVKQGDLIGKVGCTGRASGPHLHFSLYVNHNATNPNAWYAKAF